jgi:TonB-linked SusC/RagA family outer membrane protein
MRRFLALFTMLMLCGVLAFGQSRVVSGKVTDTDGSPVAFASILNKATNTGISADGNGNYSIKVKAGDILLISGAGIKTTEVVIGNQVTISTIVEKGTGQLETVIITALGVRSKSAAIGYSTASIKTGELNQAKVVNIQNGLTGKVSGLNIQSVNSGVFGDTRITLRGIRSLTGNNQPLLVVDGVPVSLNLLNTLSPNDVADITVLKSNSAAALYGQDGSNGAIIVTTKKGTRNKPTISIGSTVQIETLSFLPKLQHEYGTGETEDANGLPVYDYFTNNSFGPKYDGSMVKLGAPLENGAQQMVKYSDLGNDKYKFFDKGVTIQTDFSISGGDERSRYYFSAQDADIKGIIPKDVNRRTSFRLNAGRDFNRLSTSFNVNYSLQNYNVVFQDRGAFSDIYTSVIKTGGFIPLTSYKDWRNNPFATADGYFNFFGENPYMLIDLDRNIGKTTNLIASTDLVYKFNNDLSFTYRLGTTVGTTGSKAHTGAITYSAYAIATKGVASNNASAGNSVVQRDYKQTQIKASNLVIPTVYNVSNGTGIPEVSEFNYKIRTAAFFGKIGIGFDNKVFVEFTGRNDKDSRLPIKANSFFYPGASLSLAVDQMIPGLNNRFISKLKLRGAWTKSGNVNLGTSNADFGGAYQLSSGFNVSGGFPYGSLPSYTVGDALRDPNIKPEFIVNKEVGMELGLFKNRVAFEVTAYQQENTDQVIDISLPTSTGYSASKVNAASFTNKGIEFDLNLTPLVSLGKWRIDLKSIYTYNTNEVTSVYQDLTEVTIGSLNTVVLGRQAYVPQGRVIVDRITGAPSADAAPKLFGNTLPKNTFSVSPTVSYGGFSLTALLEHRGGNFMYSDIGGDLVFNGAAKQTTNFNRQPFVWPNSVVDDGTGKFVPNTNTTTLSGNANFWATSLFANNVQSLYYSSANFWKLREVSLSYSIPASVLAGQQIFKAATVTFSGRNLFLWTPKSNEYTDPEFGQSTGNGQGVNDTKNAPPSRIMGVTVNFTF